MSSTDPEELAQELERDVERLEGQSEQLGHEVSEARDDWERKRSDPSVPGAPAPAAGAEGDESASTPPEE